MAALQHPADLRYAKTHEWVRVEGDRATIGISDYAQNELGDVVGLDLPWEDEGKRDLEAARHFGDIDSVKSASELFSPVSGHLIKVHQELRDSQDILEVINTDPYGEGWMLVVEISNPSEIDALMTAEQYEAFVQASGH